MSTITTRAKTIKNIGNCFFWPIVLLFFGSCQTDVKKKGDELSQKNSRPNIILVMADDLGWGDVGFNGNKEIKTPFLDHMASEGVVFDRFYTASPVCSPTRASFLTGRNPLRMNIPDANSGHMKEDEITIPELLKSEGYTSGHFGKWHLGTLTKNTVDANRGGRKEFAKHYTLPTDHGYDFYFATESKVPTYDPLIKPQVFQKGESLRYGWKKIQDGNHTPYGTAYWIGEESKDTTNVNGDDSKIVMDMVIAFLERATEKKRPFFATVWFHTPHLPVVADRTARADYQEFGLQKQLYFGTISAMDNQMGRLWKKLETKGIQNNTLILFCSDNGPEKDTPGSAGSFKERKRSLYEGGIRVPAFMVWKDRLQHDRLSVTMTTSDILPTVLDALSLEYPDTRPLDGISVLPFVNDRSKQRKKPVGFSYQNKMSWIAGQYKLITLDKGGHFELYDLIQDAGEENNIIDQMPEQAQKMKTEMEQWFSSVMVSSSGKDYN